MRGKSRITILMALLVVLAAVGTANASIIDSNGNVQMVDLTPDLINQPGQPPLVDITRLSLSGGRVYTNQEGGVAFAPGNTVRTVGVFTIGSAVNGSNAPATLPDHSNLNIIFALQGTI